MGSETKPKTTIDKAAYQQAFRDMEDAIRTGDREKGDRAAARLSHMAPFLMARVEELEAEEKRLRGVVEATVEVARAYGGHDGDHHRAWVVDQMVRALMGDGYAEWVKDWNAGPDGPDSYEWQTGIAP